MTDVKNEEPKETKTNYVALGIMCAAISAAVSVGLNETKEKVVAVPASLEKVDDVNVAKMINDIQANEKIECKKQAINLDGFETIGWLCNGAYSPEQQKWLDDTAGKDATSLTLTARTTDAGIVWDGIKQ